MYNVYSCRTLLFRADSLDEAATLIDVARDENTVSRRAVIIAIGADGRHVYTDDHHWEQA